MTVSQNASTIELFGTIPMPPDRASPLTLHGWLAQNYQSQVLTLSPTSNLAARTKLAIVLLIGLRYGQRHARSQSFVVPEIQIIWGFSARVAPLAYAARMALDFIVARAPSSI